MGHDRAPQWNNGEFIFSICILLTMWRRPHSSGVTPPFVIPADSVSVSLSHLQEVFSRHVGGQTSSVDASVMLSSRLGGGWFTNLIQ